MRYTLQQIKDGTGFDPAAMFDTADEYNGWANRETWALVLQFDNDQGLYESVLDVVRQYVEAKRDMNEEPLPYLAAELVKEYAETILTADGYADTFGEIGLPVELSRIAEDIGSLYRVDWQEVGAHYLTVLDES